MRKTLIVFTYGGGRTCNQMLNCVQFAAMLMERSESWEVSSLPAIEFRALFPRLAERVASPRTSGLERIVRFALWATQPNVRVRRKVIERCLPALLHPWLPLLGFHRVCVVNEPSSWIVGERAKTTDLQRFLEELGASGARKIAIGGWGFRCWRLAVKHRRVIADLIRMGNPYFEAAAEYLASRRNHGKRLVGVLIRQTDYRVWEGGGYFLETAGYIQLMRRIAARAPTQFLVASDEPQALAKFGDLDVIPASGREIGSRHHMESFFELSLCDHILSPPSSYSLMACYAGGASLLKVTRRVLLEDGGGVAELRLEDAIEDPDFRKVS